MKKMTIAELTRRLEAAEKRIVELEARPVNHHHYYPPFTVQPYVEPQIQPYIGPSWPPIQPTITPLPIIWCSTSNGDDERMPPCVA